MAVQGVQTLKFSKLGSPVMVIEEATHRADGPVVQVVGQIQSGNELAVDEKEAKFLRGKQQKMVPVEKIRRRQIAVLQLGVVVIAYVPV